jgi:phage terminase Nu1 subunit (DNA packaging protein)
MPKSRKQLVSQRQYARLRNVSSSWISRLVRAGKIPTVGARIDVAAADRALADANTDDSEVTTFAEAQRRWRLATARLRELELKQKEGGMCFVVDVQREVERVFGNVRSRLLAMPTKMAPILASTHSVPECCELLRHEVYLALECLSQHGADPDFQIPEEAIGSSPERPI